MKVHRLLTLGMLLAFATAVTAQSEKDKKWKKVTLGDDISFLMPAEPKVMEKEEQGVKIKMWAYETPDQKGVYMIASNKLPDAPDAAEAADVLKAAANGQFQGMNGELKKTNPIKLAGKHPGLECEGTVPFGDNGTAKSRIFIVGDSMYQVLVLGQKEFVGSAETKKFVESFKMKENVQ